jgi:hypothetical protein
MDPLTLENQMSFPTRPIRTALALALAAGLAVVSGFDLVHRPIGGRGDMP